MSGNVDRRNGGDHNNMAHSTEKDDGALEEEDMTDKRFGIGRFKPEAIQCFATIGWFTAGYSMASLLMSTISVYVNSQITTLERQFGFSSKQTSLIMAANDIGYLVFVLFVAHLAKRVHIPKSLGIATIVFGLSGLVCSLPYFIYGNTLSAVVSNDDNNVTSHLEIESTSLRLNQSIFGQLCSLGNRTATICKIKEDGDNSDKSLLSAKDAAVSSLVIIVIGMMLQGFGKTPRASFSLVYIDDNTKRVKSGFYLGIVIAMSILGPAVAFLMGGIFSRIYVTLGETDLYPKHPKWIGAWWLGFLVFGGVALVVALPLFCFPAKLPRKSWDKQYRNFSTKEGEKTEEDVENPSHPLTDKEKEAHNNSTHLTQHHENNKHNNHHNNSNQNNNHHNNNNNQNNNHNNNNNTNSGSSSNGVGNKSLEQTILSQSKLFLSSVKRLVINPVLVLMVCSQCSIIFMVAGQSAYSPKYLERIFDLPAYKANYIMAGKTLTASCVGTFIGGLLTRYYKMTAKQALRFTVCVVAACTLLSVASLFTYCDQPETHNWPGSGECAEECHCGDSPYFPVCGGDGKTYYSPCMAGCVHHEDGTYTNCTCIDGGQATIGICPYGCDQIYYFAIVSGLRSLFGTLTIIPKVTVMIRAVEDRDKSMALGLSSFLSSLIGWLGGPVMFGILIDGICVLWDIKCGVTGRCLLYDNSVFRWKLNGLSSIGIGGSLFFQVCALIYSWKTGCLDDIGVEGRRDELDGQNKEKKTKRREAKEINNEEEEEDGMKTERKKCESRELELLIKTGENCGGENLDRLKEKFDNDEEEEKVSTEDAQVEKNEGDKDINEDVNGTDNNVIHGGDVDDDDSADDKTVINSDEKEIDNNETWSMTVVVEPPKIT